MKCLRFLLSIVAGAFFLCVATPASLAQCHQPTTIAISYTWPPNNLVAVHEGSVPTVPLTTAMNNWNAGLYSTFDCYPSFALDSGTAGRDIFMSYAPLPPPPQCPPGFICFTRGVTDLQNAKFLSGRLSSVNITINSAVNANDPLIEVIAHEFGHTFALNDCYFTDPVTGQPVCPIHSSVMEKNAPTNSINGLIGTPGPTTCDLTAVAGVATDYRCPPPPPPPDPCPGQCQCGPGNLKGTQTHKGAQIRKVQSTCCPCTPIIIDTSGNGFTLTSAVAGVKFDMSGKGYPVQMSWTAPGSSDAFLALPGADGLTVRQLYTAAAISDPFPPCLGSS